MKVWRKVLILLMLMVFIAGLGFLLYPYLQGAIADYRITQEAHEFLKMVETRPTQPEETIPVITEPVPTEPEETEPVLHPELLDAMKSYNSQIWEEKQSGLCDPWSYEQPSFKLGDYGLEDEVFGVISIPKLELEMPIYLGATYRHMADGTAHLSQTSLPIGGENTNCVIAGHRGWGGASYFRYITELEAGDEVIITNLWGELRYTVVETKIIDPNDVKEMEHDIQQFLTEYIGQETEYWDFSGVIRIVKNGKTYWETSQGYSCVEFGVKNTMSTRFTVASVTKQFTAFAIMLLYDKGMSGIDFRKITPMPSGLWMGGINPDTRFRFGKNNWLDWSIANWGTKWNALRFDDDDQHSDSQITFVTADGTPAPIMQKLSEMYPEITMHHFWAEDNVGHNCGERIYKAGSVIEEFKPEPGVQAVDYACKIMGTTPADHCLKLNEDGTEYICAEEEDMDESMEEGMHL